MIDNMSIALYDSNIYIYIYIYKKYLRPGNSMTYSSDTVMTYNQNTIDSWTKGCILPFPKKGGFGIVKNYRGISLTSIAAKIYNALLRNPIEPKFEKILRKNRNDFRRNRSTISKNFDYPSNSKRCTCKRPYSNNTTHRSLQGIWLHTQGVGDGANTSCLRLPKRNSCSHNDAIEKHKVKAHSPDADTN